MTSPAHAAALAFLRGALIAVVSQVVAAPLAGAAAALPFAGWLSPAIRIVVPLGGFAFGAAAGGAELGGRQGAIAFGGGGLAAGLILTLTAPNLSGLTGYENPVLVVGYAAFTCAAAYAACGLVGASLLAGHGFPGSESRRRLVLVVAGAFAVSGAAGGLAGVVPFLAVSAAGLPASGRAAQFLLLASSVASVAIPFCAGGALAARALHDR